jgi:hypothetical protein
LMVPARKYSPVARLTTSGYVVIRFRKWPHPQTTFPEKITWIEYRIQDSKTLALS